MGEILRELSMTTDYVTYLGDPKPYLERIAEAGFTHIHWCHEWNTTHIYSDNEISNIQTWLQEFDLKLLDLHAPHGEGMGWGAGGAIERSAAVKLLKNRLGMTARLSGGAIVVHLPNAPSTLLKGDFYYDSLQRSLDVLWQLAEKYSIKIAIENMDDDDFLDIDWLFERYNDDFLGLCYDSGHGNLGRPGLDNLERYKGRLVSIHIHDNDGTQDRHNLPFSGTVDWVRLSKIIASSSYKGCVSLEANMRGLDISESEYLREAYQTAAKLEKMIQSERQALTAGK
ncbi:MAG: sugar phosphate isomerase/epimerase [Candidatus Eisenbacteria bacterium]|uniref:Sugar phosphate isomerase/epimerase n=1 Tax=Eiseniibacteriota bacterium TaxID=2212470 RepID=A0A948W7N0_UNCEI|nr:sugar phosphate isomerase/epimerase [Candidatus Eisenbacteria bacterium]MBU1947448.1 sugar phosphate isomerase/epimerase [Candidatus Eisenbacteria bacterium]MBU2692425.1 sugar phosphate isomerase/epimerase [Candidatus Eisenbacteria bacterium]